MHQNPSGGHMDRSDTSSVSGDRVKETVMAPTRVGYQEPFNIVSIFEQLFCNKKPYCRHTKKEQRDGYVEQISCVNNLLIYILDEYSN